MLKALKQYFNQCQDHQIQAQISGAKARTLKIVLTSVKLCDDPVNAFSPKYIGGEKLKVVYQICCGVDVHKKFLVGTIISTTKEIQPCYEKKRFSTHNGDLNRFADWLIEHTINEHHKVKFVKMHKRY